MQAPTATILNPDLQRGSLTVVIEGKPLTIRADNPSFPKALEAYAAKEWAKLVEIINPVVTVAKAVVSYGNIEARDNSIFYMGEQVHGVVVERILQFIEQGLDVLPLVKFLDKLMLNPSKRAVDELYTFLEHKSLPVTDNGNFLAYKGVRSDWYSVTSGTKNLLQGTVREDGRIFNGIGEVIEMPRNKVDDDKNVGCSYGLHAGTLSYASGFSQGHLLIVEIDPADVVSIPTDCSCQKLRTAKYKVVGEYEGELTGLVYRSQWSDGDDGDEDYVDADGDALVDGDLYYSDRTVYKWNGDNKTFVDAENGQVIGYDSVDSPEPYEQHTDGFGTSLYDGELYRDDDGEVYSYDASTETLTRVKPNDQATFKAWEIGELYSVD